MKRNVVGAIFIISFGIAGILAGRGLWVVIKHVFNLPPKWEDRIKSAAKDEPFAVIDAAADTLKTAGFSNVVVSGDFGKARYSFSAGDPETK